MRKVIVSVILCLLGVAGAILVPVLVGFKETLTLIGTVGITCIIIFVINGFFQVTIPALGLGIIMRENGNKVSIFTLLKANLMGFWLNFITPSFYIGGEPLKIAYISDRHNLKMKDVLAAIIVNKIQELGGVLLLLVMGFIIILVTVPLATMWKVILAIFTFSLVLLFLATFLSITGNFKPIVKFLNLLISIKISRAIVRKLIKLRTKALEVEEIIRTSIVKKWKTFILSQIVTALSCVSLFIRPWIFFYFLSDGKIFLSFDKLCLLYSLTQLILIFQIIPANLGVFEGSNVGFFSLIGARNHEAAAFALLARFVDVCLIVTGVWLVIHYGFTGFIKTSDKNKVRPQSLS